MLNEINAFFEVLTIFIFVFLIERYVYLEQGLEVKKQQLFYWISILFILIAFILFGKDIATYLILFDAGLNIFLSRKEHRFYGFFLIIPISGIINGLLVPFLVMPARLRIFSKKYESLYCFMVYILISLFLLLFYLKGKNWRKRFKKEAIHRHLQNWEQFLLFIVGALMLIFSIALNQPITTDILHDDTISTQTALYISLIGFIPFILTVTILVLIMQGNKRSYYHNQVSDMQFNVISTMADIIESRDKNTGGHIKRTAKYVEIIAKTLEKQGAFSDILTKQYVSDMIVAAPLHDIGKIHISDIILNKPGKFTDEEFQIMKSHAAAGRDLLLHAKQQLGESTYLNIAVDMAGSHHEWWNGKGYPDGIKEEEIPLCARIMAVADVFDALVSKRCYKSEIPLEKAYRIIREESGTHFDPVVVEAFFSSTNEIEAVLKNFE